MGGYILRGGEKDIPVPAQRVDRLIARADSDAALLYLFLLRADRGVAPEAIRQRLRWSELRLNAAESTLQQLGLLEGAAGAATAVEPAEERPAYTTDELAAMLEADGSFANLVRQAEERLGKRMKTADLQILAGLYDDLALPPDVIYLLVCHCVAQTERKYGSGRRPTMRQIEKEGYFWARQGLFDQESADRYLKEYAQRQEQMGVYRKVLQIHDRRLVDSEEKYIRQWIESGFSPELVALAYDQTVFYKRELNWRYLNAILRRWEENGWRTPEDVERGSSATRKPAQKESGGNEWMRKYIKR